MLESEIPYDFILHAEEAQEGGYRQATLLSLPAEGSPLIHRYIHLRPVRIGYQDEGISTMVRGPSCCVLMVHLLQDGLGYFHRC